MRGRFSLFTQQDIIEDRYDANSVDDWQSRHEILPQDDLAVITNDGPEDIDHLDGGDSFHS